MRSVAAVALRAAERLEAARSTALAFRAYRALFGHRDPEVAGAALERALGLAVAERDGPRLSEVTAAWRLAGRAALEPIAIAQGRALWRSGRRDEALEVAEAEVARSGGARAWYLLGRLRMLTGWREGASEALGRAIDASEEQPRVAEAAREALAAIGEGEGSHQRGSDAARLHAAREALTSTSGFRRAAALSSLVDLAEGSLGREAVRLAAEHADRLGPSLSWAEAERLATCLARFPDESAAAEARRRLAAVVGASSPEGIDAAVRLAPGGVRALDLARAVVAREPLDTTIFAATGEVSSEWMRAVAVIHDLRRGAFEDARRGLVALTPEEGRASATTRWPNAVWTAARLALAEPQLREPALGLAAALLQSQPVAAAFRLAPALSRLAPGPRDGEPFALLLAAADAGSRAGVAEAEALRRALWFERGVAEAQAGRSMDARRWLLAARDGVVGR
ncbi:MAG: hypothetical protein R3B72_03020 [Polyangiaceae bacterium]